MFHNCDWMFSHFPICRKREEFETEPRGIKTTICTLSIFSSDCLLLLTNMSPENVPY